MVAPGPTGGPSREPGIDPDPRDPENGSGTFKRKTKKQKTEQLRKHFNFQRVLQILLRTHSQDLVSPDPQGTTTDTFSKCIPFKN